MTDTVETTDEFLAHFGIKGMKWGVRHVVGPTGRVSGKRATGPASRDHLEVRDIRKKHISEMSNEELRKLTARVDLEQKYSKIIPSTLKKGKIALTAIIGAGTTYATVYKMLKSDSFKWGLKFVKQLVGKGHGRHL